MKSNLVKIIGIIIVLIVVIVLVVLLIRNVTQKNTRLHKVSDAFQSANQQFKKPLTTLNVVDSLDGEAFCDKAPSASQDDGRIVCNEEQGGDVVITASNTADLAAKLNTIDSLAAQNHWSKDGAQPASYLQSVASAETKYASTINGQLCSFSLSNIANDKTLEEGPTAHILRISIGCHQAY